MLLTGRNYATSLVERCTMEESNDRNSNISGGINNKMTSDSGYGSNSNKSNNSQSQRSSGSSKSHQSSLSSGSCSFLSHPTVVAPKTGLQLLRHS
ncbi:unnamed protein product [Allacma fusca]|uniref:Uncharacterized protein n=1 Tax=Allacma fusca TaxID=39272 RepID=A0A8J2NJF2_9HEXA|nr:unnamed protein product [Allacma fusca]